MIMIMIHKENDSQPCNNPSQNKWYLKNFLHASWMVRAAICFSHSACVVCNLRNRTAFTAESEKIFSCLWLGL